MRVISDTVRFVESPLRCSRSVKIASDVLAIVEGKMTKTFTQLVKIVADTLRWRGDVKKTVTVLTKIVADTVRLIEGSPWRSRSVRIVNEIEGISEGIVSFMSAAVISSWTPFSRRLTP